MKDKIESTILLTTIIFPISMFIINKILGIFDWHLRYWIWTLVFFVIHAGGYSFSIFAICTMKSKIGKCVVPRHREYYNNDGTKHTIYFDKKGNIITREESLKLDG